MQFTGAFTALVTPFRNGAVDEERYRELIEWQIEQGINGLVPCGTTGESATLSHEEHREVIRICVEQANKRVPVLAGAGSNNTREAVDLTRYAKEAGADGALLITPYYNKPTQEGLYQHFKTIAANVDMPFILYNVPSRTGTNMLPGTLARLKKDVPQIKGVKEATGNMTQVSDIIEQCGDDFQVLSGDDFTVLPLLALGGCGVISVVSNIIPAHMATLCSAFASGDITTARREHLSMQALCRAMFIETNPIPVKIALSMMGKMGDELRLPLVPLAPNNEKALRDSLHTAGLL